MADSQLASEGSVGDRRVVLSRGRLGWWVEGRSASGRLFMKTWWPARGLAWMVARMVGGPTETRD
jgi:hypothetical protein